MENIRPKFDKEIVDIYNYVANTPINSDEAYETAYYDFLDSLACAFLALDFPACTKLLGPIVPHATLKNGARVPGTPYELDPVQAAFNNGTLIRWLDYNDTWLAAEWGHPSDNLGGILAVTDYLNRANKKNFVVKDLLTAMIKAHEIQGIIALENSFNKIGLDHVVLVKVATTAVTTHLFGGTKEEILNAISLAWIDGHSLRTYRHAPNTGSRKSWAAGDATSRGVRLALLSMQGEMGYPSALTAKKWGLYDVYFSGKPFTFPQSYGSYVMENILFKISFPAEFHAQTAVECAIKLYEEIKDRLDEIEKIEVKTQEPGIRIITKEGPLNNPADRDHCLQYMIAIGLIFGNLTAKDYEDDVAKDPRIDKLREKMNVTENKEFTKNYYDPKKRGIGNSIKIYFKDGSSTEEIAIEYPIGHRRRREEAIPLLKDKFEKSITGFFQNNQTKKIIDLAFNQTKLTETLVHEFVKLLIPEDK